MVQDIYSANLQSPTFGDKLSDKFLGTNKVAFSNINNNYELQKAVNINKYAWNKYGMIQSGINPLIASNNLANVVQSQATSNVSNDPGIFGNVLSSFAKDVLTSILDKYNPKKFEEKAMKVLDLLLKFI